MASVLKKLQKATFTFTFMCPNQRNLFNFIVSVRVGFLTTAYISWRVYRCSTPPKMHVYVSLFRQFTHRRCSTPPKMHVYVSLLIQFTHRRCSTPPKMHVYVSLLRQFTHRRCSTPPKMHVYVTHDALACYTTRWITECSKTYRSCQGSFQLLNL